MRIRNGQPESPLPTKQQFSWGFGLGMLSMASLQGLYFTFCIGIHLFCGQHGFKDGAPVDMPCPDHITPIQQIDELNLISRRSISDDFLRTSLGYGIYLMAAGITMATMNMIRHAYHHRSADCLRFNRNDPAASALIDRRPLRPTYTLFNQISALRKLDYTRTNKIVFSSLFTGFLVFNAIYGKAYFDASKAAKTMLPNYGLKSFKAINQGAEWITFFTILTLNQWFAFFVLEMIIDKYRQTKLIQYVIKAKTHWPWTKTLSSILQIAILSTLGTIPFFGLAINDDSLSPAIKPWIALSSIPVYACVLNTVGAMELLSSLKSRWHSLSNIDTKLPKQLDRLKQYGLDMSYGIAHLTGLIGYPLYEAKMWLKELSFLLNIRRSERLKNAIIHSLDIPNLLPLESVSRGQRPKLPLHMLEQAVNRRMSDSANKDLRPDMNLLIEIIEEAENLINQPTINIADIWRHGRVRTSIFTPLKFAGPLCGCVMLFAYFSLVKGITAIVFSVDNNTALAATMGFLLYIPFINLVLNTMYNSMSQALDAIENTVISSISTVSDFSSALTGVGLNQKTAMTCMTASFYLLKIGVFMIATASSAPAVTLLDMNYYLHTHDNAKQLAIQLVFWGTALLNSAGFASGLNWLEGKIRNRQLTSNQRDNTRHVQQFFRALTHNPELESGLRPGEASLSSYAIPTVTNP